MKRNHGDMAKNPRVLALFDVDGTLTEPRKVVSPETLAFLAELRKKIAIGVVGGSDLVKQKEQLGDSPNLFNWCFAENGLLAHKDGAVIGQTSIVDHLGEANLKRLVNWILAYFSTLDIPVKRGTFIEFRQGMLNVSPIGRNCSREERNEFEKFDLANKVRETMVDKLKVRARVSQRAPLRAPVASAPQRRLRVNVMRARAQIMTIVTSPLRRSLSRPTPRAGRVCRPEADVLDWRPDLVRRLPSGLGQDLLPPVRLAAAQRAAAHHLLRHSLTCAPARQVLAGGRLRRDPLFRRQDLCRRQ